MAAFLEYQLPHGISLEWNDAEWPADPQADKLKSELDTARDLLEAPSKDPQQRWSRVFGVLDFYKTSRYQIATVYNGSNVTNAWLKMYELCVRYDLARGVRVYFANAELPGSFVLAFHHYITTSIGNAAYERGTRAPEWFASSIIEDDPKKNYLEDRYGLRRNYPDRWITCGNGDTTKVDVVKCFATTLVRVAGGLAQLYTSDAGIDVSSNYNDQERMEAIIHFGQTVAGLATLAPRGNMVLKTFTYFASFSLSLIYLLTTVFKRVLIVKPISSRPSNSEVYLVCQEYEGATPQMMTKLYARMQNFSFTPLVARSCIPPEFFAGVAASHAIFSRQIKTIREYVAYYEKYRDNIDALKAAYGGKRREMIQEYLNLVRLRKIDDSAKLKIHETINK